MTESPTLERLLARAEAVLGRLEGILPLPPAAPDWESAIAFRWRKSNGRGWLQAVRHPHPIRLSDLETIDDQKERITANTRQFVAGKPANNVLLTGARGSGKSSLVKAMLNEFAARGLRLIEVDRTTWSISPTSSTCSKAARSASSSSATTSRSRPGKPPTRRSSRCSTARSRRRRTMC